MPPQFRISAWAAFAPGLESQDDWRRWAQAPHCPQGEAVPALAEMPAMQRRRVETLGRMALQVAWRCEPEPAPGLPMVFVSRHGDIRRTFEMLEGLARDEPLSPTHFGLSTHNAIAAQYSIARGLTGNYLALSAGNASVEAGVCEALGLLADGEPSVLLVAYDAPPPTAYDDFQDEAQAAWAWAWRLEPARSGEPAWSLQAADALAPEGPHPLPAGLETLRAVLGGDAAWTSRDGRWRWSRHG